MQAIGKRLTYSNVVSTLALFLVLAGGAAYAAKVAKKSVGPAQLKAAAEQMIALLPPGRASGTKARRHGNKTGRAGAASS